MIFIASATIFILAVILLFLFDIGPGEEVIALITVFITSSTGFGSVLLMRKMHKSDIEMNHRKNDAAKARGNLTLDEWLDK